MDNSTIDPDELRAINLRFTRGRLTVLLNNNREITVPLAWYPPLQSATRGQRSQWRLIGKGIGIHWPTLDLDVSVEGLVNGLREAIPQPPACVGWAVPTLLTGGVMPHAKCETAEVG